MIVITCDGCRRRIAEDDRGAVRGVPMFDGITGAALGEQDWCGGCVAIIRAELPRLAEQAREARRDAAALPVQQRARQLWPIGVNARTFHPPKQQ